jgi:hypothetical protein
MLHKYTAEFRKQNILNYFGGVAFSRVARQIIKGFLFLIRLGREKVKSFVSVCGH